VDGEDAARALRPVCAPHDDAAQGKRGRLKIRVVPRWSRHHRVGARMNLSEFLRIERESADGSRHYVLHTHDPKFSMELIPDRTAPDKMGRGVIKRVLVPNSWAGDYTQYSKFITAGQDFFEQSRAEPAPKTETRRLGV
jgi:hypothetical protein